ncbi:MAG: DUF2279 domain-containing protein [Sphingobium sp.]
MRKAELLLSILPFFLMASIDSAAAREDDGSLTFFAKEGQDKFQLPALPPPATVSTPMFAAPISATAEGAGSMPSFDLSELNALPEPAAAMASIQGPPDEAAATPASRDGKSYASFGSRLGAAKWETLAIATFITASQAATIGGTTSFHFKDEGWFGKNTNNLGIDKLTHAFNAYLFAEFLGARIARKSGDRAAAAAPAALLAMGLQFYGEMWDAHKKDSGFSTQDVIFNGAGALFSVIRHSVPGLEEKLDFRLMLVPNSQVYSFKGKRHYEQQRFLLSLELAGFERFRNSPLRFAELQVGYRGKNFLLRDREAGREPKREIFFGVALNLKELFFKNSRGWLGQGIGSGLNYFQIPYTATHSF